jgi:hypothetical protein
MKPHPFEKYRWNRYGFEVGQEVEWFEWLHKYKHALRGYREQLKKERFDCSEIMERYIQIKDEILQISQTISEFASGNSCRQFHGKFLKSKKVDAVDLVKFKTILLKKYEESEKKDASYYLSIVNNKIQTD